MALAAVCACPGLSALGADQVARWRYGRAAALSLSSDDGAIASTLTHRARYYGDPRLLADPDNPNLWGQQYRDTVTADTFLAICGRYGISMTFYLDTRQIDEPPDHIPANPSPGSPAPNPPWEHDYGFWPGDSQGPGNGGSWDDWAGIAALGHEIASHSVHHPEQGIDALHVDAPRFDGSVYATPYHGWLPAEPLWWKQYLDLCEGGVRRSFQVPADELAVSKWRIEQQLRARAGTYPSLAGYNCVSFSYPKGDSAAHAQAGSYYVSSRLVGGGLVNGDTGPADWQLMPCVYWPANDPGQMIADLNLAIAGGHWLHESGHAMGHVFCCYLNEEAFETFVAFAAGRRDAGVLWIATVGTVSRYLRERLDSQLEVDRSRLAADATIRVRLTLRTLHESATGFVYDVPLTLFVDVPGTWGDVRVEQADRSAVVRAQRGVLQFDAIPDVGEIILTRLTIAPVPADFDLDGDVDLDDFGHLQRCMAGETQPYAPGCGDADLNSDGDVDRHDFEDFSTCLNGSDQVPGCQ